MLLSKSNFTFMRWILALLILFSTADCMAQCATFRLNSSGDTLNCVDLKGNKQGKWVIKTESLRGEPGFEDEGEFENGKRTGPWRRYNLIGDLIAVENYRWGNKDGLSQYFNIYGLEHEEFWHATNPLYPYDTVYVPNVNDPDKYEMKVVRIEATTVKHGNWRYYDPESGKLVKTESYLFDKLQETKAGDNPSYSAANAQKEAAAPNGKPKEVADFEKKILKKKKIYIRDGTVRYDK